jgi:hypothetical protein
MDRLAHRYTEGIRYATLSVSVCITVAWLLTL